MSDTRPDVPAGWAWVTLGEIALEVRNGISTAPREEAGVRILRISAVRPLVLDVNDVRYLPGQISDYGTYELREGDVLFTRYNGNVALVGAAAHVPRLPERTVYPDKLIRVRLPSAFSPRWLSAAMSIGYSRNYISFRTRSTAGQSGISGADLKGTPLPVAPEHEQKRVVHELDSYLSRLDAAVAGLKRVQANLKRYRASVLKAAVEGRLVPTEAELAKAEGRSFEPASELLARILKERRARWEAAELASMQAKGKRPKDDKWKSKYQEPTAPNTKGLPELPEGWCWATVDQLAWASSYGTSIKCDYDAKGLPVLRIPNIASGRILLEDVKHATKVIEQSSGSELLPGDFLVVRTNGSRSLIGRAAPVLELLPTTTTFASYLIRFRMAGPEGLHRWVRWYWACPLARRMLEQMAATSAGQYNLSQTALAKFPVPIPPLAEAVRAQVSIEDALSIGEAAEKSAAATQTRCSRLRQSILKWAFEGKLVDQDPNDEPASALLERIRAERDATAPAKKRLDPKTTKKSKQPPAAHAAPKPRRVKQAIR